jgi:hypothetical protein
MLAWLWSLGNFPTSLPSFTIMSASFWSLGNAPASLPSFTSCQLGSEVLETFPLRSHLSQAC